MKNKFSTGKAMFTFFSSLCLANTGLVLADLNRPIKAVVAGDINLAESRYETMEYEEYDEEAVVDEYLASLPNETEMINIEYSGMTLDHEYEEYLYKVSEQYNIPFEALLTFGYVESNGTWDTNGKISPTNDYGQFQINKSNHRLIMKHFGWADTVDEVSEILLYDREKNAEAAAWLISLILNDSHCKNIESLFGMYNAYIYWQTSSRGIRYKNESMNVMHEYFDDRIEEIDKFIKDIRNGKTSNANKEEENSHDIDENSLIAETSYVKKLV